jgi:long-chain acyl-CoA synthetase
MLGWSDPSSGATNVNTILDLMERAVADHGPRTALIIKPGFRTRRWTYAQIGDLVPRVARLLRDTGIEPGDRVLIWAVNRPEWAIAFLGVLWAEGVAVPVDVRTAEDFATRVAGQTRPKLILASMPTEAAARRLELPMITVESLVDRAQSLAIRPLERPDVESATLAEVVFTSGTTGDPKGVMLSHGNIASNAIALKSVVPLGPTTRLLSILPLSHTYGLNPGMVAPMITGACVIYPTSLQPPVLARTFREHRVTMLLAVPQVVKLLTNAIERKVDASGRRASFERLHRIAPHLPMRVRRLMFRPVLARMGGALRYLAVGAAAMNPNIARRWENMGVASLQGYGATETSPVVAFTRIERNRIGTVGEVIPGVQVRIAPDGEILVQGPNVFQGYWERPDATEAVLKDGWYHSGDHGVLDADGFLTLQGRKKDMLVMSDGTKVHPIDVERVLIADPAVRDAAVIGLEGAGGTQVHAVLILRVGADPAAVISHANSQLGGHQQIRGHTIWPDDEFPRTATTKVKKDEVQRWVEAGRADAPPPSSLSPTAIAAASGVERLVRQLDGIPTERISPDARLSSDLGIDSLGRVELVSLIEEELGVSIDDGDLDPDETIGALQARVNAGTGTSTAEEGIYGWPLNPVLGALRIGIHEAIVRPLATLLYRRRVRGLEHLAQLDAPVLFAANHHLHNDNALILLSIPLRLRWKLSVAAALDGVFETPWRGFMATLIGNAFPLARTGAIRRSLDRLGARLDRGYSVLIYPEGQLTVGGPLQELKTGTGLVAVHGAIPVVPVRLNASRHSRWDKGTNGRTWRGDVEIAFGAPLRFGIDVDPVDATEAIREAIEALASRPAAEALRPLPATGAADS